MYEISTDVWISFSNVMEGESDFSVYSNANVVIDGFIENRD